MKKVLTAWIVFDDENGATLDGMTNAQIVLRYVEEAIEACPVLCSLDAWDVALDDLGDR